MVERIVKELRSLPVRSTPHFVMLAGGSCSGKSYLARALLKELSDEASLLALDDFQLGEEFPLRHSSLYRWDDPENFAPSEALAALSQLAEGKHAIVPRFNLAANRREGVQTISPSRFVIVDGLYSIDHRMASYSSTSAYMELPFYARFLRRVLRFTGEVDPKLGGVPVRHMLTFVYAAHRRFVSPQRSAARHVLTGSYSFAANLQQFRLENSFLTPPHGKVLFSMDLPEGASFQIRGASGETAHAAIFSGKRCVFCAEIDMSLINDARTVDWFSM